MNNFISPKSIYVPSVHTECCKIEFASNYPNDLDGIISQNQFLESINRINRRISSTKFVVMFVLAFALSIIGAIICFIVGLSMSTDSGGFVFIGLAIALFLFGIIFNFVGCFVMHRGHVERIRKVIKKESDKYSSHLPVSCTWRLNTTTEYAEGIGNYQNCQLIIDIHDTTTSSTESRMNDANQMINESTSILKRHDDSAPPPYSSLSMKFCSQCGTLRQSSAANFCSSCGNSFVNMKISI
ncbi:hypothetical protein I4U23_003525 [Adineta vaga]|nr:hypothetical protein I4U23_003525 [Adineta vaga]